MLAQVAQLAHTHHQTIGFETSSLWQAQGKLFEDGLTILV